jgi:hypothetical protein
MRYAGAIFVVHHDLFAGDFMAVNSDEFRAMRGFVEPPINMHADSLGLIKLVHCVSFFIARR